MLPDELPADISHRRFTWIQHASQVWTDEAFRAPVIVFALEFEASDGWVRRRSVEIEERFTGFDINARVPFGPTASADLQDDRSFKQRQGEPVLIVRVTRERDGRRFEVSLPFPDGAQTSDDALFAMLEQATISLRAVERQNR